jgi:hypothetical protein
MSSLIRRGQARQLIIGFEDTAGDGQAIPNGHEIIQTKANPVAREQGRVPSEARTGLPSKSVGYVNLLEGAGSVSACLTANTAMVLGYHLFSGYAITDQTPYFVHEFTLSNTPTRTLWVQPWQADVSQGDVIFYGVFDGFTIRHTKAAGPVLLEMPFTSTATGALKNQALYDAAFTSHISEEKFNMLFVESTVNGLHSEFLEEISLSYTRNVTGKLAQDGTQAADQLLYDQADVNLEIKGCVNDTDDLRGEVGSIVPVSTKYVSDDTEEWVEFVTPECAISEGDHEDDNTKVSINLESNAGIQSAASSLIFRVRNQIPDAAIYLA